MPRLHGGWGATSRHCFILNDVVRSSKVYTTNNISQSLWVTGYAKCRGGSRRTENKIWSAYFTSVKSCTIANLLQRRFTIREQVPLWGYILLKSYCKSQLTEGITYYTVYDKHFIALLFLFKYKMIYFGNYLSYGDSNDVFGHKSKGIIAWNPYSRGQSTVRRCNGFFSPVTE